MRTGGRGTRDPAFGIWALPLALAAVIAGCGVPPPTTTRLSSLAVLEAAGDSGRELPRPPLPTGADTNAAASYYQRGEPLVRWRIKLDSADAALYWASRLDPSWAEPLYARSLIPLSAVSGDAFETWSKTRSVRAARSLTLTPRQLHWVDSLQRLAWHRNPFMFSDLEFTQFLRGPPGDAGQAGWYAFSRHQFQAAESLFAIVLHKEPNAVGIRIYRSRALFYLGRYDSAAVELEAARDTLRRNAEARLSPVVPSVEMFEFAIGIIRVQQDDFPAARAAFQRALADNLGSYWAHARLAGSELALHDTAAALSELEMAVQLEEHDPLLRFYYAGVLQGAGRLAAAEVQWRRAIELDPYYAAPYYWLAVDYQFRRDTARAIGQYRQYLARAASNDPNRAGATRALTSLLGVRADSR